LFGRFRAAAADKHRGEQARGPVESSIHG
jgi:hypothetical protein